MATTLQSTIMVSLGFTQSETLGGYSNTLNGQLFRNTTLEDGSGESQAHQIYPYEGTLSPSGTFQVSLNALTVSLSLGASGVIDMNQIRAIAIYNENTGSGEILHFGGGTTPWMDFCDPTTISGVAPIEVVGPGDVSLKTNVLEGFNISNSNIRLYNPNNVDLDFQILIVGSSR